VKEDALADLILVNGNPLDNLDLVADPDKNFVVIMKDGKIYKNNVHLETLRGIYCIILELSVMENRKHGESP